MFELYRKSYERKHNDPYEILGAQKVKKGDREILKIQHNRLFVALMTGRRSFLTNLWERADELGIKEMMNQAGYTVIGTTLGYIMNGNNQRKVKKGCWEY